MATRISFVLLLFALAGRSQNTAGNFPLDSIAVEGNRILSAAAILSASGLARGETGGVASFDAARDRLLATGYFDSVAYRYRPSATKGFELTIEVKEVTVLYPIRVEALPVATGDMITYLKSKDPLFTGRIPGTKPVLDRTAREIDEYLAIRNKPAQVAGRVVAVAPGRFEAQFTPARGLPVVASVTFEGSKAISAIELHNKMNEVAFGQPFSDSLFHTLLQNQIGGLYEGKGYMGVKFLKIATQPAKDVEGLDVKVTLDEGAQYKLSKVSIEGGPENESEHLLRVAKLPDVTGKDIANFDQIREAAGRVKDAIRHEGYLDGDASTDREIDDAAKTVEAFIVVDTGPRYKFGKLTVNGLGLDGEAAIRKMWSVSSGDPFPVEYPKIFAAKVKEEGLFDNLGDVTAKSDIDRDAHVANVTLDFKTGPRKERPARKTGEIFPGAGGP